MVTVVVVVDVVRRWEFRFQIGSSLRLCAGRFHRKNPSKIKIASKLVFHNHSLLSTPQATRVIVKINQNYWYNSTERVSK